MSGDERRSLLSREKNGGFERSYESNTNVKLYHEINESSSEGNSHAESHCHSNSNLKGIDKVARRKLIVATIVCFIFMIIEIVGGVIANSLIISTDAAHLLTDIASFMISLFSLWYSSRPATRKLSFGYYRVEVIGALTSVLLIWVVTGILVLMAVQRLISGQYDIDAKVMLITASFGIVANIIMAFSLHGGHGHSHGSKKSHATIEIDDNKNGEDVETGAIKRRKVRDNINVRAAYIHVIGDFIQSLGVFIAALVIYFKPTWSFLDPVCTFLFSVFVLMTTISIINDVLHVLMEGIPKGIDLFEVSRVLTNVPGVLKVHNLRIWSLSMDKIALSAHLAIDDTANSAVVLKMASDRIREKFDIFELTIQIEEYREEMKDCTQCKMPDNN